jgi:hypothetical protein
VVTTFLGRMSQRTSEVNTLSRGPTHVTCVGCVRDKIWRTLTPRPKSHARSTVPPHSHYNCRRTMSDSESDEEPFGAVTTDSPPPPLPPTTAKARVKSKPKSKPRNVTIRAKQVASDEEVDNSGEEDAPPLKAKIRARRPLPRRSRGVTKKPHKVRRPSPSPPPKPKVKGRVKPSKGKPKPKSRRRNVEEESNESGSDGGSEEARDERVPRRPRHSRRDENEDSESSSDDSYSDDNGSRERRSRRYGKKPSRPRHREESPSDNEMDGDMHNQRRQFAAKHRRRRDHRRYDGDDDPGGSWSEHERKRKGEGSREVRAYHAGGSERDRQFRDMMERELRSMDDKYNKDIGVRREEPAHHNPYASPYDQPLDSNRRRIQNGYKPQYGGAGAAAAAARRNKEAAADEKGRKPPSAEQLAKYTRSFERRNRMLGQHGWGHGYGGPGVF